MFYTRTTRTASGATAVQVVRYQNRRTIVVQHLGSAFTTKDLQGLRRAAVDWIAATTKQLSLLPSKESTSQVLLRDKCTYLGFRYGLLYETLSKLSTGLKFHLLRNKMLTDLVVARIAEPSSKLQSLDFLKASMGIQHQRSDLYRQLPRLSTLQGIVESKVLAVAKKEFRFSFSLVFYDVTTLYFETLARTGCARSACPRSAGSIRR